MSELDSAFKVIEELMEPCEKCGKSAEGARWCLPGAEEGMAICEACYSDKEGFHEWFAAGLADLLDNSGEYEKLPNGKYRLIEAA